MNVSLTRELERLVTRKVKTGMYQTASEVVREGLRLLKERDDDRLKRLKSDVRAGFEQVERGESFAYDKTTTKSLAQEIKARGRRKLTQERKKTGAG